MSTFNDIRGKKVLIILDQPIHIKGFQVRNLCGEFGGGVYPGPFSLNAIESAYDDSDQDVTQNTQLSGKTLIGHSPNIRGIVVL